MEQPCLVKDWGDYKQRTVPVSFQRPSSLAAVTLNRCSPARRLCRRIGVDCQPPAVLVDAFELVPEANPRGHCQAGGGIVNLEAGCECQESDLSVIFRVGVPVRDHRLNYHGRRQGVTGDILRIDPICTTCGEKPDPPQAVLQCGGQPSEQGSGQSRPVLKIKT